MSKDRVINNCNTVNGGIIKNVNGMNVEILSHNFHNPHCNIVCYYIVEDGIKKEITYYENIKENNIKGSELYFFKNKSESQHYYSRHYKNGTIPKRYNDIVKKLKEAFKKIDFELYKVRTI